MDYTIIYYFLQLESKWEAYDDHVRKAREEEEERKIRAREEKEKKRKRREKIVELMKAKNEGDHNIHCTL